MIWNYQLGFKKDKEDIVYGIVEVYRNSQNGGIMFTTEHFVDANHFEDASTVIKTLEMMLQDCKDYPVLDLDNIEYVSEEE